MNHRMFFSGLCILILVSLLASPALAATLSSIVTCPSSCSCLLPAEAAKINAPGLCGGKQTVCGYEGKISKYCYARPVKVTVTTTLPQLLVTGFRPVPTTGPVFVKCSPGCYCEWEPWGDDWNLTLCGGREYLCDMDQNGVKKYCYVTPPRPPSNVTTLITRTYGILPATSVPTNTPPPTAAKPAPSAAIRAMQAVPLQNMSSCAAGCACLRPADAGAKGLKYCNGKQIPCTAAPSPGVLSGSSEDKETRYCYSMLAGNSSPAPVLIPAVIRTTPIPIPPGPEIALSASGPNEDGGILSMVGAFFSSVLEGRPQESPSGQASLSMCRMRYGLDTCTDGCVNLSTDPDNCGSCGHWCRSGEWCVGGRCSDFDSDPANCGGTGNICPAGAPCIEGYCSALGCLDSSLTACNNTCTRTRNDPSNCGACGNACPEGQYCFRGNCTSCGSTGEISCMDRDSDYSACTDISTDRNNCGECQHACGSHEVCIGGICVECPAGTEFCLGGCVDFDTSSSNCGGCGRSCGFAQTCQDGTCRCNPPLTLCSGQCVDLNTSMTSCGFCSRHCADSKICSGGICTDCPVGSDGYTLCSVDGYMTCVNTNTDKMNCGHCGNRCFSSWACIDGACHYPGT